MDINDCEEAGSRCWQGRDTAVLLYMVPSEPPEGHRTLPVQRTLSVPRSDLAMAASPIATRIMRMIFETLSIRRLMSSLPRTNPLRLVNLCMLGETCRLS